MSDAAWSAEKERDAAWRQGLCRIIGHSWKWTGGWIKYECRRCGKRG